MSRDVGAIEIAPFRPEHLNRLLELTRQGFVGVSIDYWIEQRFGETRPGWEARKLADIHHSARAEPEGIFVALDGEQVVAYVTTETSAEKLIGRIRDLAVDADYRRLGIGSRLIDEAIAYCKRCGMRFAKIETLANNEAGQAAYPRRGFVEVARQIHYVMPLT